jgi:putative DNA primase/helicase
MDPPDTFYTETLSVEVGTIPDDLKNWPQWVGWKAKLKPNGKLEKVPYNTKTGRYADPTDSLTWSPFADAFHAYQSGKKYDGIGFVFSPSDPYAGVDLDGCRDPETGHLEEWASEIIQDLDGFTEASPRGKGVHITVRGEAPNKRRNVNDKGGKVEAYSSKRFFTFTGNALRGAGKPIEERQPELDALTRKYLSDPEPPKSGNSNGRSATSNASSTHRGGFRPIRRS